VIVVEEGLLGGLQRAGSKHQLSDEEERGWRLLPSALIMVVLRPSGEIRMQ
jgi:hypothetical protein